MSQKIAGTFASAQSSNLGAISDVLVIPSGVTVAKITLGGVIDASNTCKTQKTTNGLTWSDVTTYNSAQSNVSVTVAHGEQWRIALITQQVFKQLEYSFSVES